MTADELLILVNAGVPGRKTELIEGRLLVDGRWPYVFGPEQARAAAALGVNVKNCLEVALEDPVLRAEAVRRLCGKTPGETAYDHNRHVRLRHGTPRPAVVCVPRSPQLGGGDGDRRGVGRRGSAGSPAPTAQTV